MEYKGVILKVNDDTSAANALRLLEEKTTICWRQGQRPTEYSTTNYCSVTVSTLFKSEPAITAITLLRKFDGREDLVKYAEENKLLYTESPTELCNFIEKNYPDYWKETPQTEQSTVSDMWPLTCKICGYPAYQGFNCMECSNPSCELNR